jgi:hypothetical protein
MEYKLSKEENNKLNEYWQFIDIFDPKDEFYLYNYRNRLLKTIKKKYTIEEFYFYENILNKMLWNLLIIYDIKIYNIDFTIKEAFIINDNSYINKQIMKIGNKIVIFPNYAKLNFNEKIPENLFKIFYILSKRKIYEKVINDKNYINKIDIKKIDKYYYPNDYPFPNISLVNYNNNPKKVWIKRIKAYYYSEDDSSWKKLIQ